MCMCVCIGRKRWQILTLRAPSCFPLSRKNASFLRISCASYGQVSLYTERGDGSQDNVASIVNYDDVCSKYEIKCCSADRQHYPLTPQAIVPSCSCVHAVEGLSHSDALEVPVI